MSPGAAGGKGDAGSLTTGLIRGAAEATRRAARGSPGAAGPGGCGPGTGPGTGRARGRAGRRRARSRGRAGGRRDGTRPPGPAGTREQRQGQAGPGEPCGDTHTGHPPSKPHWLSGTSLQRPAALARCRPIARDVEGGGGRVCPRARLRSTGRGRSRSREAWPAAGPSRGSRRPIGPQRRRDGGSLLPNGKAGGRGRGGSGAGAEVKRAEPLGGRRGRHLRGAPGRGGNHCQGGGQSGTTIARGGAAAWRNHPVRAWPRCGGGASARGRGLGQAAAKPPRVRPVPVPLPAPRHEVHRHGWQHQR